ncbi:MAG: alpha/beta hydrolase [Gordonia sp. (in: high G+C Gram-positive bacteria)]|uniref:alpha/beta hydrolase n=1 Tax=Gordonia sp. (in: high G+C Gram-positive bacteria) TaxID=84139 RepID=UPI0039E330CA
MPIVQHRSPSRVSYAWWLAARFFLKPILAFAPIKPYVFKLNTAMERRLETRKPGRSVVIEKITLGGSPTELVMAKGPTGASTDTAVLYLHGGAFMACGPGTHRTITTSLAKGLHVPVFAVDYRQLPEGGVGTSVHDAFEAYRELLGQRGFRYIIVAGDSAGGFLTGKVAELAAANDLPAPIALAMLSPLLDLDLGERADRTSKHDAYLPIRQLSVLGPMFDWGPIPFVGARRINDVDPLALPPTIIITAEDEMVEPDALELATALDAAGRRVELHSYPWQIHAFTVMLRHREGQESVNLVVDFLAEAIADAHRAGNDNREVAG